MAHGPCAGVSTVGACEVPDFGLCSYLDVAAEAWPYSPAAGTNSSTTLGAGSPSNVAPLVVADALAPALDRDGLLRVADALAPVTDALLIGDSADARVQFPPSYRARLVAETGARAWVGLNCRDRNRVALEGEIAACVDAGALALHCVTGDHPSAGHRPDAHAVFDLDSLDLVRLAALSGVLCSVAHAPAAPPVEQRLPRLLAKIAAGAGAVFVDGPGDAAVVGPAVAALRAAGFSGLVLVCVTASDGLAPAARRVKQVLALPGVDGVNLSGGAAPGDETAAVARLAQLAALTRDGAR
jgi:hypothetical protein